MLVVTCGAQGTAESGADQADQDYAVVAGKGCNDLVTVFTPVRSPAGSHELEPDAGEIGGNAFCDRSVISLLGFVAAAKEEAQFEPLPESIQCAGAVVAEG
jgi:hypothetical protein